MYRKRAKTRQRVEATIRQALVAPAAEVETSASSAGQERERRDPSDDVSEAKDSRDGHSSTSEREKARRVLLLLEMKTQRQRTCVPGNESEFALTHSSLSL